jgi:hypothetical protein
VQLKPGCLLLLIMVATMSNYHVRGNNPGASGYEGVMICTSD